MLKYYMVNGHEYQYEEGEQPAGAVELMKEKPKQKAEEPENKAAKPANKARKAGSK
jgi:hypothetical protein